jgi:hypothetical protein
MLTLVWKQADWLIIFGIKRLFGLRHIRALLMLLVKVIRLGKTWVSSTYSIQASLVALGIWLKIIMMVWLLLESMVLLTFLLLLHVILNGKR